MMFCFLSKIIVQRMQSVNFTCYRDMQNETELDIITALKNSLMRHIKSSFYCIGNLIWDVSELFERVYQYCIPNLWYKKKHI